MTSEQKKAIKSSLERYIKLQRDKIMLEQEMDLIKKVVVDRMGNETRLLIDGITVTNTETLKTNFDTARFKLEQEALYNSYLRTTKSTRFSVH